MDFKEIFHRYSWTQPPLGAKIPSRPLKIIGRSGP